jgi:hypothetical protein
MNSHPKIVPGFTFIGLIIALIGTLLIGPDVLFGYGGLLIKTGKQAEEQYKIEHAVFAGDEDYEKEKMKEYSKKIRLYRLSRFIGIFFLILGLGLQIY